MFTSPDMHYSPAINPQEYDMIGKRAGNLMPPEGTIPYKASIYTLNNMESDYKKMEPLLKDPFDKVTSETIKQGKEKYRIYCSPCHGLSGKGDGPVKKKWAGIRPLVQVPGVDVPPIKWPVKQIYHVIEVGIRSMQGYSEQIRTKDKWAIAHYVKYLQAQQRSVKQKEK